MENENKNINWTAIIVALIIGVVILGAIYFVKSQNSIPIQDNPKPTNPSGPVSDPVPVPVPPSPQALQAQCEVKAQKVFDIFIVKQRLLDQTLLGSDSIIHFTHTDHYNNSMGKCIMAIYESVFSRKFNSQGDTYSLFNLDNETNSLIGQLGYNSIGSTHTIIRCTINSQPCSSIEEYTRLTTPYLNN